MNICNIFLLKYLACRHLYPIDYIVVNSADFVFHLDCYITFRDIHYCAKFQILVNTFCFMTKKVNASKNIWQMIWQLNESTFIPARWRSLRSLSFGECQVIMNSNNRACASCLLCTFGNMYLDMKSKVPSRNLNYFIKRSSNNHNWGPLSIDK